MLSSVENTHTIGTEDMRKPKRKPQFAVDGERIKARRIECGLSVGDVAYAVSHAIGYRVTDQSIRDVEAGGDTRATRLYAIATVLRIKMDKLIKEL